MSNLTLADYLNTLSAAKGKFKPKDLDGFLEGYDAVASEVIGTPKTRARIQRLLAEAVGLTVDQLKLNVGAARSMEWEEYEDDFLPLVPESGLVSDYCTLMSQTECPTAYNFFSFLTVMGTRLGRSVYVDQQVYRIWPNMCVILVGPSGNRKTTAANFAKNMGEKSDVSVDGQGFTLTEGRFMIIAEKATSEAIHSELAGIDPAVGLLYAPELSTFINKKDYNRTLVQDLSRLWDCPDTLPVRTVARSRENLKNVAISFLACSNEAWLSGAIPEHAFKGGFMARQLLIYQPRTGKLHPFPKPLDDTKYQEVLYGLVETGRCTGPATLTRTARQYFKKRYREIRKSNPPDERFGPFFERIPDHMLRLALLLSISESRTEAVYIDDRHLIQANALLEWITSKLGKVYSVLGVTNAGEDATRIVEFIARQGNRVSRSRLTRAMTKKMTLMQMDERLKMLKQGGMLAEYQGGLFDDTDGSARYYKLLKKPEEMD